MATALVIDDSRLSADSLCQMLEFLGVKPLVGYGPRAAMLLLQQHTPDIIFLDINMNGVDGFEVLAYLRRLPQLADVPVVFITSDDQAETARKVKRTGALHLILKPASMDIVERILHEADLL